MNLIGEATKIKAASAIPWQKLRLYFIGKSVDYIEIFMHLGSPNCMVSPAVEWIWPKRWY